MANLNSPSFRHSLRRPYTATSFSICFGRRQLCICRDFRKRYYNVGPVIDCSAGTEPGYLEVLFFRRWLLILSKRR